MVAPEFRQHLSAIIMSEIASLEAIKDLAFSAWEQKLLREIQDAMIVGNLSRAIDNLRDTLERLRT